MDSTSDVSPDEAARRKCEIATTKRPHRKNGNGANENR
jgi:hypothetical protein